MPTPEETAAILRPTLGQLYRRLRQTKLSGDLTLSESSALGQLRRMSPTTSAQLAKAENISPQAMGTTLAALENKGLVKRAPDPSDGRRVILSLTHAGQEVVDAKRSRSARQLSAALATLSEAERAQLLATVPLLERLAAALSEAP